MRNKDMDLRNKVIQMMKTMPGGKFYLIIAKKLRNSHIISSILCISEVWYAVTNNERRQLEEMNEIWMQIFKN